MKVHGANLSPFVRKVRVALAEKGISAENVFVFPNAADPEWRKKSPLGKIPVLETDSGKFIPDSSVILAWLERVHPEPALHPADPDQLADALFLEEYADTRLIEVCAAPFANRVVKKMMGQQPDEAAIKAVFDEKLEPTFGYLEQRVPKSGDVCVGKQFSVADIAIASPFVNFHHAGEKIDAARFPKLAGFVERVLARPSFTKLVAEEKIPG